jgi:2-desacetyl-2-hydroxyethyl bacteriochlorophyllide A dehydrogenase
MKAAIFNGPHNIGVINYEFSKLLDDQVLIKVKSCGICGTDFHIYEGKAPAKPPVILGHEYVGEVIEVGKGTSSFRIGDHIAVNPNIHCGYCYFCKLGKINLCQNLKALGVTNNGGLAQYSVVPVTQAYLLPADFPFVEAAFAEPLSCCLHGIDIADIKLYDTIAVIGAGTIGLLMIQLAKLKGALKIIAIDVSNEKLSLAKSVGADYCFNPSEENFYNNMDDISSGGADIIIECAGNENAAALSVSLARKGGRIIIFGLSGLGSSLKLNLQEIFHKELSIRTSLLNPFTFQNAVDLLITKKIKVNLFNYQKLILDDNSIKTLFNKPRDGSVIKYMIIPN